MSRPEDRGGSADTSRVVLFGVQAVAYGHSLLVRSGHGRRHLGGWVAVAGVVVVPWVWLAVCPPTYGAGWHLRWWGVLVALHLWAWVGSGRAAGTHSRYIGTSRFGGVPGETAAGLGLAVVALGFCNATAGLIAASTVCHAVTVGLIELRDRRSAELLRDAEAEARSFRERYRRSHHWED